MKKGGLCKLDVRQLAPQPDARLGGLLTPQHLRAIGD